jgi:hypothetical protein
MKKLIADTAKKVINLWKTEEQGHILTPVRAEATFKLSYGALEIGALTLKNAKWVFTYSAPFKQQSRIKPLENFPDVDKTYESDELFPFFVARIPGTGQPKVQEVLAKEKADGNEEVVLLKRFGARSIANPFELLPT